MSFNTSPHQPYPYHNTSRGVQGQRPVQDVRVGYAQPQPNYQQYPQQGNQQVRQQMMPTLQMQYQMQQQLQQQQQAQLAAYNAQQSSTTQKNPQQQVPATQQPSTSQQSSMPSTQAQKPIAPPSSMMLSSAYTRTTISELVQVPPELTSFAADPQFQMTLLKVKEQTGINFISLNRITENSVESVAIDAPTKESAQLARNLIETHFKLQQRLQMSESRLKKVETEYFSAQGEIASGMMVEFSIPSDLIGLIIGKKGARIKQIEQETGVTSINVNGESGRITVNGPDSMSVQRAREQLELHEESFDLSASQAEWLNHKYNGSTLADIKQVSNLMLARVNPARNTLDVVGVIAAVRSAKLMLATQLEYIDKQIEVETNEKNIRERLSAVRKQYGINNYQSHTSYTKNYGSAGASGGTQGGKGVAYGKDPAPRASSDKRGDYGQSHQSQYNAKTPSSAPVSTSHGGSRNDDYAQSTSRGGHSRNSSTDSLHHLPPPPPAATASKQQPAQPSKSTGSGTSSRTRGADIDSIIGSGLSGGGKSGVTSIEEATHLTREQFAAMAKSQHHNQGYTDSVSSSQDARGQSAGRKEKGKGNKDKDSAGGSAAAAPSEKRPNKESAHRLVTITSDEPVAPTVARKAPAHANQKGSRNSNKGGGGNNKEKDNDSGDKEPTPPPPAAAAVVFTPKTATSLLVTPPVSSGADHDRTSRQRNKDADNGSSNNNRKKPVVKPLTVPPPPPNGAAQPMLLQIIQGHQEAAAAAANAEHAASLSAKGKKPSAVKAKKDLISAVSIVSVTTGNKTVTPAAVSVASASSADKHLAGAMAGLTLDDKDGDRSKKQAAKGKGGQKDKKAAAAKQLLEASASVSTANASIVSGSTVPAPVSVPGPASTKSDASKSEVATSPAQIAAEASAKPAAAALLVHDEPALPKRAKRNPGTSAVVDPAAVAADVKPATAIVPAVTAGSSTSA